MTPPPLGPRPALSGGLASTQSTRGAGSSAEALPPGLAEAYLAGELVVFAGADVSLAAGLPAGDALPQAVLREAQAYLDHEDADELDREVRAALADRAGAARADALRDGVRAWLRSHKKATTLSVRVLRSR